LPLYPPPDDPPGDPQYVSLDAGTVVYRIHSASFAATEFNPTAASDPFGGGRFDSSDGSYSYMYAGTSLAGAAAETLLRDMPESDWGTSRVLPYASLPRRQASELQVRRTVRLVNLSGPGALALGQDSWLTSCDSVYYPHTRHWAQRIREWCPRAAGFIWRSRIDNDEFSIVVFGDRVTGDTLTKIGRSANLVSSRGQALLASALAKYSISLP